MRVDELGRLLPLATDATPAATGPRRRGSNNRIASRAVAATLALGLSNPASIANAASVTACTEPGPGWCIALGIDGHIPGGELGFRFGEPLDVDGDGRADIAAGARFALQGEARQNGSVAVWSGASGARVRTWPGTLPDGLFGHWVLPVPDLDGDGLADVVISSPNARHDGFVRGVLEARSAKSGEQIWKLVAERSENLGWDLSPAGDHDGDGAGDLFVGAPATDAGRAYLVSGKTGKRLRTYAPPADVPTFGWYVARLDDLDGDGQADVAVGAHLEKDEAGHLVGAAYVVSAATGNVLRHWRGPDHLSGFGEVVAAAGDLDGDGKGEVVVAAPRTNDQSRSRAGDVRVYSGATGELLRQWSGSQSGELYGRMVASAGDVDGDGVGDLAIGAPWHRRGEADRAGRFEIRSGRSGDVVAELFGDTADSWLGWHIRRAPDPEGRGRPALLVGSLRRPVDGHAATGAIDLYVLRGDDDQGTTTRDARRNDIK